MRRRGFLAAAGAGLIGGGGAWADVGMPDLVTAASDVDGQCWLVALDGAGRAFFRLPLPARGHAAAVHPGRAEAVLFARRPGRFGLVFDCVGGAELARLEAPEGRHFYGHGAFTPDGGWLLTTENAFEDGAGRIGVWDAGAGYRRVGDLPSGGIGPHQILALPSGGFAVANGGVRTHPDHGRARLNLPEMRPNLALLDAGGGLREVIAAPEAQRLNSIRHMAVDGAGRIALALQWQGDPRADVPLAALYAPDSGLRYLAHPDTARLKHYAGSVAFSADGARIAVTGPKGGHVLLFDGEGRPGPGHALPLASGAAALGRDIVVTCAEGLAVLGRDGVRFVPAGGGLVWDNHLVAI